MSSIEEVVAQLLTVIQRLDQAVIGMNRGQADVNQAHESFVEAGRGSEHRLVRTAITASSEGAAKAGKVARLLAEASGHFAAYANEIAPGSASTNSQAAEAAPPGEHLVREADRAEDGFGRLARRVVAKAESAGDTGKKLIDFLNSAKPSGTTSTTQKLPPPPRNPTAAGTPGDAAQALIITGAALVAAVLQGISFVRRRRDKERD